MTTVTHPEAQIAANQTRTLWLRYREVGNEILARTGGSTLTEPNWGPNVGRVVRLLREQKRILDALLGGQP